MERVVNFFLFVLYAIFSGGGLIILKTALTGKKINLESAFEIILSAKFIIGFSMYVIGFALWMIILSKFKLNIAFPIAMSLFFIVSSLGSYFILQEVFNARIILGMVFCLIGIIIISTS
ncbi:MAG: hypothetical protein V3V16_00415 [Melioribacteraceae bacterium]